MADPVKKSGKYSVEERSFTSKGTRCGAHLYLPPGKKKPPVVVMAHGFGAEMSFRLPAFAERFVERGMAVFMFDYRNFGKSDGNPRNLVNPWRHLNDWRAALEHVRTLEVVDSGRIALWGSSFSGGHVVVIAAEDPVITALVSQVPFMDGIAAILVLPFKDMVKGVFFGIRDLLRIVTFRKPYFVPIVAKPDTFAPMNRPDAMDGYLSLVPEGTGWENKCPARIALTIGLYRPISKAKRVSCPALVIEGKNDSLFRPGSVAKAARMMNKGELVSLDCGHFEPYTGKLFEKIVETEADFLAKHLLG